LAIYSLERNLCKRVCIECGLAWRRILVAQRRRVNLQEIFRKE
jgi:hypothetical protein